MLGNKLEFVHAALAEGSHIVVAKNKIFAPRKDTEDVIPKVSIAVGEVSQMKDKAVFRYGEEKPRGCPQVLVDFGIAYQIA